MSRVRTAHVPARRRPVESRALVRSARATPSTRRARVRAGDEADVFHTFFGIAGLALLKSDDVLPIDPAYALPVRTMQRLRAQQAAGGVRGDAAALVEEMKSSRIDDEKKK